MDEQFLGNLVHFNPETNILSVRVDFIDPDKQKIIEDIITGKKRITFKFSKPYRTEKTYPQLKFYFAILKHILVKIEIAPDSEVIKAFDVEMKKMAFDCKKLEVFDQEIPLIPSKADMTIDMMRHLIEFVLTNYSEAIDDDFKQQLNDSENL